jgi:uncharacterized protein with HEPN domain
MTKSPQRLGDYLSYILEAIERIEGYLENCDEAKFLVSPMIQDAVIRNFEVVGEASKNIERNFSDFAKEHSEVPFLDAYEMRNALSHGYFKVDLDILWKTIQKDLPILKIQIQKLIASF